MSDPNISGHDAGSLTREEMLAAQFAQMVLQQANMAMMLLGKVAHPQTGETMQDLEGAKMFIDQLEMLEAKTKGNLGKEEAALLKQSLYSVQMAFVDAVEKPAGPPTPPAEPAAKPSEPAATAPSNATAPAAEDAESKKKFSKKY
jgi:hypothetical protein